MKQISYLLLLVMIMNGCSAFKASRRIDMTPFAENTSTLFSEASKISRSFQWKHLKPYLYIPDLQILAKRGAPVIDALNGIVYYSNQVVAINNSNMSASEKNHHLARYISDVLQKAVANQKVDSLQLDAMGTREVIANIQNAKTYLDGIAASGPIVNTVVLAIQDRLDEIQQSIPSVLYAFDREIEREYAPTRKNYYRLVDLQTQLMLSATRLYRARIGDLAELDTLLQQDISIDHYIPSTDKASAVQLAAAESHILDQLGQIDIMFQQLDEIKTEYLAKQDELIAWRIQLDDKIRIARNAITIWAQSHRNLGAGIPVPPLIDVKGIATGMAGTAVNTAVPF